MPMGFKTLLLLNDRFRPLWEGRRTATAAPDIERDALDWSHNLLSERERLVLPQAFGVRRHLYARSSLLGCGGRRRRRDRCRRLVSALLQNPWSR